MTWTARHRCKDTAPLAEHTKYGKLCFPLLAGRFSEPALSAAARQKHRLENEFFGKWMDVAHSWKIRYSRQRSILGSWEGRILFNFPDRLYWPAHVPFITLPSSLQPGGFALFGLTKHSWLCKPCLGEVTKLAQIKLLSDHVEVLSRTTSLQKFSSANEPAKISYRCLLQGTWVLLVTASKQLLDEKSPFGEGTRELTFFFVRLISSPISFLTWEYVQVVGGDSLNHWKTFSKEQPFLQAAKLWIYPHLSRNRLHSQIPSAKNADLSNLRHWAGDAQSALTLCSFPAQPGSPLLPDPGCQTRPHFCLAEHPCLVLGWSQSWRAAGSLHPAAGGYPVLGCFSGHSCPPAPPWCPLPPRPITKHSVVLHVNTAEIWEWSISSLRALSSWLARCIPEECSCLSPGSFL